MQNQPAQPAPLSDALLARASKLHDAAYADPDMEVKPSWAESVAAAQAEAYADKSSPPPPPDETVA